jgi:hypothetical protein
MSATRLATTTRTAAMDTPYTRPSAPAR